jgi:predicted nucleic acid-binding protein
MSFLDTNVVVRYLTGQPIEEALKSAEVIDNVPDLKITDVVLHETAYVLTSQYGVSRSQTVDYLIAFLRKNNIATCGLDKSIVIQSLLFCRGSGRVSFGDALIWATARVSGDQSVYSFDKRFPDDGIELIEP